MWTSRAVGTPARSEAIGGPEQHVVAGQHVDRLALERRARVVRVGRGGPHYHAVARACEGAERRARLRVADEILGAARAVRRLDERLEATARGGDVRGKAVLGEDAHVMPALDKALGEPEL